MIGWFETDPEMCKAADVELCCRTLGEGQPGRVRVLLLHGLASHAGWWRQVAERLSSSYRVTVLEFSGHGQSGWRSTYSGELWAEESMSVLDADTVGPPWVMVGHSMGGAIAAKVASHRAVAGVLLFDTQLSPVSGVAPFHYPQRHWPYASLEQVKSHFRVWPPEDIPEQDLHALAVDAVRRVRGRFVWSFDPTIFSAPGRSVGLSEVLGLEKPFGLVRGAGSPILSQCDYARVRASGRAVIISEIVGAQHHFIVTHPEQSTALIRAFIEALPLEACVTLGARS